MAYNHLTHAASEDAYLQECVAISPDNIQSEFVRISADMAYWGAKLAAAVRAYLLAEQATKECRAMIRISIRETHLSSNVKLTVDAIDAMVEADEAYQRARFLEIEAEAAKVAAKLYLDAIAAKKDMLMSLGAHIRAEFGPSHLKG